MHGNASFALLLGSLGCLLISLSGRFLLGLVLHGNLNMKVNGLKAGKDEGRGLNSPKSVKDMIDPAELAAQAMSEAATTSKPLVETKA